MRVARSHQSHDDRRRVVVDLLTFIHDFNQLDTTLLIAKAHADFKFVEAAEAILQSAIGPWRSVEALRDFAVQALSGEKPPAVRDLERARPRGRVSPFSVPFELLRAMAPNPGTFNLSQLQSLSETASIEFEGYAGAEDRWPMMSPRGEAWLVTTVWARVIPTFSTVTTIEIRNPGDDRILHRGKLWGLVVEPMPCFWWLPPYHSLDVKLTRQQPEPPAGALIAIEGWRYTTR